MSVKRKVRAASTLAEQVAALRLVEPRAEPLEGRQRGLDLGRRRVLVAAPPERDAEREPRLRRLVGRAHVLPLVARALQEG